MRTYRRLSSILVLVFMLVGIVGSTYAQEPEPEGEMSTQATLDTTFTYQGKLTDGGEPAAGEYDLQFELHDDATADSQVGSTISTTEVITEGLFTVALDFGEVFDGTALWLEIGVRPGDSTGSYTALSPRQALNATPYALGLRPGAKVKGSPGLVGTIFEAETPDAGFGGGFGQTFLLGAAGAYGHTDVSGMGVYGQASNSTALAYGVYGLHDGSGDGYGGYFQANGETNAGLYSEAPTRGIVGRAYTETLTSTAVLADGGGAGFYAGAGVRGLAGSGEFADIHPDNNYFSAGGEFAGPNGVIGVATARLGYGIFGKAISGTTDSYAGYFQNPNDDGVGVYASGADEATSGIFDYDLVLGASEGDDEGSIWTDPNRPSSDFFVYSRDEFWVFLDHNDDEDGEFQIKNGTGATVLSVDESGNLDVDGNISKSGGGFKIDHPLDPENQYLYHSFVEAPERTNIYNGNVTTDGDGFATVQLPDYFETLNKEFTYQLTVIGTFAQAIVAEEINENQFVIQTDEPNVKVSWQVTGVRQDPYAEANPFEDEVEKSDVEQGGYIHPELYDQPASRAVGAGSTATEDRGSR